MLKHTSNASSAAGTSASAAGISSSNGQLRNSSSAVAQQQQPRSIHLRPPQPLNISTLSAASLSSNHQTSITPASPVSLNTSTVNGGQRINLLNIVHNNGSGNGVGVTAAPGSGTTATSVTPVTPIIPNGNVVGVAPSLGIGNNRHTYTNQHITATNNTNNNQSLNNTITANGIHHSDATMKPTNNNVSHNYSNCRNFVTTPTPIPPPLATSIQQTFQKPQHGPGPREAMTSLGLLCLVSLLFALLSLIFLLKISPNGRENSLSRNSNEDFVIVYDVTLALCALSLSLNVCCLLVCAIQFLFAVKLLRSPMFNGRENKYLEKSSVSRTCAVGGFFISIPIFLTGIILYTFNHFHSTPAIITSVLIGVGIVFCGCAMVHNVFVWQKEKTISYRSAPLFNMSVVSQQFQQLQQTQQEPVTQSIGPVTPPTQFLNSPSNPQSNNYQQNSSAGNYITSNHCHAQQTHSPLQILQQQQHHHFHQNHGTSMTPVSPNHSHGSFNPLLAGALSSSFLMRPATATPPTPKPIGSGITAAANTSIARATSPHGSVSPGQGPTIDISNITNTSLHELSTLV